MELLTIFPILNIMIESYYSIFDMYDVPKRKDSFKKYIFSLFIAD